MGKSMRTSIICVGGANRVCEILFVDPSVSDLPTLLSGLRPSVEAIMLDPVRPAAQQMAEALRDRSGLDAVHVIAHGAPGRISFFSGEWTQASLNRDAAELAAIGRALGERGELRLWCCETGARKQGEAFVLALAEAAGAEIAASAGLVGSAELGGSWALADRAAARPPLTAEGIVGYEGVLATTTWKTPGTSGNWSSAAN